MKTGLLFITTDHGRDSATGRHHGGQSAREKAGWIVTNAKELNDRFKNQQSSMVDIMPTIARFMGIDLPAAIAQRNRWNSPGGEIICVTAFRYL